MKHKYVIQRNVKKNALTIQEFAELDKDDLSLICEETYPDATVKAAMAGKSETLMQTIRTHNFYPPNLYAKGIAGAIIDIYNSKNNAAQELIFDDLDFITKDIEKPKSDESINESSEMGDLIEEEFDEAYEDKKEINNINSPIKVADDEILDIEEDT
jgi:hypothetical protein